MIFVHYSVHIYLMHRSCVQERACSIDGVVSGGGVKGMVPLTPPSLRLFCTQHLIADAYVGLDQVEARPGGTELFTQGCHIDAQGDYVRLHAAAPDAVDDIGVGQDLAGIRSQE